MELKTVYDLCCVGDFLFWVSQSCGGGAILIRFIGGSWMKF